VRVSVTFEIDRPRLKRPRRRPFVIGAVIAALLLPAAAWANHQFTDVPTTHTFHSSISRAKDTGLTQGCSATTFCPNDPVTRGQMTAFLNRGLGRVSDEYITGSVASSTLTTVGSLTIRPGNPTGGNQFVMLIASVNLKTNGVCPCEVFAGLYEGNGSALGVDTFIDLAAVPGGGQSFTDESATLLGVAVVPTGTEQTFLVKVSRLAGSANIEVGGRFQAITAPFDWQGNAPAIKP
jgi:hypothetical protein